MNPQISPADIQKSKGAFTLIELLTVIAIIGILAAIMMPVVSRVRASARNANCVSNLRQVHIGIMGYAADNKDYFPSVNMRQGGKYVQWWRIVQPYMGASSEDNFQAYKVQQCPEVLILAISVMAGAVNDPRTLPNYGMNDQLGQVGDDSSPSTIYGKRKRLADVRNPSRTILAGDNSVEPESPQARLSPDKAAKQGDKHRTGSNFVWVDGHVSSWKDVSRLEKDPYSVGFTEDVWSP